MNPVWRCEPLKIWFRILKAQPAHYLFHRLPPFSSSINVLTFRGDRFLIERRCRAMPIILARCFSIHSDISTSDQLFLLHQPGLG